MMMIELKSSCKAGVWGVDGDVTAIVVGVHLKGEFWVHLEQRKGCFSATVHNAPTPLHPTLYKLPPLIFLAMPLTVACSSEMYKRFPLL